jgi:hypothetical protein
VNRRRAVIFAVGLGAWLAAPLVQGQAVVKVWRIGILFTDRKSAARSPGLS